MPVRIPSPSAAIAAVVLAAALPAAVVAAGEASDARVRSRVFEATEPSASAQRRGEVAELLAGASSSALARALREAFTSSARRRAALELAAHLRVRGVFESARRHADGPDGAAVAELALAVPEDDARSWLVARWRTAVPGAPAFDAAHAALCRRPAGLRAADAVAASLDDPVRASSALEVLRFQLAVDDADPAALRARWSAARARFEFEGREFEPPGRDLFDAAGPSAWRLRGARRVARNVRIAGASCIDLPALPVASEFTVYASVAAPAPGAAFVLGTGDGAAELRVRRDAASWFLVEGPPREGDRVEAPSPPRVPSSPPAWSSFVVRVTDPGLRDRPLARDVRIFVDGCELRPSGGFWRFPAPPRSLGILAAPGPEPTMAGGLAFECVRP